MQLAFGIVTRPLCRSCLLPMGFALVLSGVYGSAARADASFGTTFGGAGNSFSASIGANASFTVGGGGTLKLSSPPILGTPIGLLTANVNLPTQTKVISANVNINTNPSGTGTISLQDLYNSQANNIPQPPAAFPPGPDGRADEGSAINSQMSGTQTALNVDLIATPQEIGVNSVTLTGSGSFDILGLFPVTIPLSVQLDPSVMIQNLNFTQTGAAFFTGQSAINPGFADGAHPNVPMVQNLSTQYAFATMPGDISGAAMVNVDAEFSADFGIFGTYSTDVGPLSFSESLTESFGLIGLAKFIEIATASGATDFDDLLYQLNGDITAITGPLEIPIALTGFLPLNEAFNAPLSLGFLGTITFAGEFNGSLAYTINGTVTLNSLVYSLQSQQIADAVNVPEASSLALLGLTGVSGLAWSQRRRLRP